MLYTMIGGRKPNRVSICRNHQGPQWVACFLDMFVAGAQPRGRTSAHQASSSNQLTASELSCGVSDCA